MSLFEAIDIAGSGLSAERVRMDVTSENLANAQTTRTPAGGPYQRQEVVLQQVGTSDFGSTLAGAMQQGGSEEAGGQAGSTQPGVEAGGISGLGGAGEGGPVGGVQVAGIVNSSAPDQLVYNPASPEANAQGYVKMPNVDTVTEMTDLITESRSYEADVTAMQTAKSMFNTTLGLLK
jgi:flagellar basal-body rod protein FlgC